MKGRWWVWLVLPAVGLAAWTIVPLATGARTLVLRDVLNTHLMLRAYPAARWRELDLPLVDPLRSGGQPALGNPNTVALYPDNLLLFVGSTLWQLNAHFWLHWLAAFAAAFWLARACGQAREGAAAAAAVYGWSGFMLSQMNLYNAVAGAALAPALAAAALESRTGARPRRAWFALALVWCLLLLGGDPLLAALALGFALALALAPAGTARRPGRLAAALALGTLLAAPQWVETARALPQSYRAHWGSAGAGGARGPAALADLLVPMFFGRPDADAIWGQSFFGGFPPLYFTLFPGLLAVALALAAPRPGQGAERAAWALAGLALALGFGGTLWAARFADAAGLLRYPDKLLLWAVLAFTLAAGRGAERLAAGGARRRFVLAGSALAATAALLAAEAARGAPAIGRVLAAALGERAAAAAVAAEAWRWASASLLVAASLALGLAAVLGTRRAPARGLALLLAAHAGTQAALLSPLLASDDARRYARPPAWAAELPREAVLVAEAGTPPVAGMLDGRRYEFVVAPEGLDHFTVHAIGRSLPRFEEARRMAIYLATGVELVVRDRPLADAAATGATPRPLPAGVPPGLHLYDLPRALPAALVAGDVRFAPHLNAALAELESADFDARRAAVVAGEGAPRRAPTGSVRVVREERERLELEVAAPEGGVLVLRRAYLPLWRAEVDGAPARPVIANLTRLGLDLPPGARQVTLRISRAPLAAASAAALAALAALFVCAPRRTGARTGGC